MAEIYASEEQSEQMQLVQRKEVEIIDKLISHGIDVGDIKNLQDVGIYTCNDLLMYKKEGKSVVCTTTGRALDEHHALSHLLSYGKTLLEIPTSVKGKNEKAAYINTEGTFRPDLVVLINEKFGMDATAVLDNARGYTSEQQDNLLFALPAKMAEEPFRSLTVDSIAALFQIGSSGNGEVAEQELESVGYEPVVDDDTGDEADDQDDEAGEDDLDDDEMDADEADADEADDLADDDEHEENDDDMSEVEEDFPDEVGSIPIVVAVYDGDEVVEERTIKSISYELSESLQSLPQLEAKVKAKIEGSQLLPKDYECYYQTSKSRYGGDFANMPTEYCYLVHRLDRILIDRPQQD